MKHIPFILAGFLCIASAQELKTNIPPEAEQSIALLRESLHRLTSPPKYEADCFLATYQLTQTADALKKKGDLMTAGVLYAQAWNGLRELKELRPEYEPKLVDFKMSSLEKALEATPVRVKEPK